MKIRRSLGDLVTITDEGRSVIVSGVTIEALLAIQHPTADTLLRKLVEDLGSPDDAVPQPGDGRHVTAWAPPAFVQLSEVIERLHEAGLFQSWPLLRPDAPQHRGRAAQE
jgi:hypothetical protein